MIKHLVLARIDMIFGNVWQKSLELCKIGTLLFIYHTSSPTATLGQGAILFFVPPLAVLIVQLYIIISQNKEIRSNKSASEIYEIWRIWEVHVRLGRRVGLIVAALA
jgi:hypothetical protein